MMLNNYESERVDTWQVSFDVGVDFVPMKFDAIKDLHRKLTENEEALDKMKLLSIAGKPVIFSFMLH